MSPFLRQALEKRKKEERVASVGRFRKYKTHKNIGFSIMDN